MGLLLGQIWRARGCNGSGFSGGYSRSGSGGRVQAQQRQEVAVGTSGHNPHSLPYCLVGPRGLKFCSRPHPWLCPSFQYPLVAQQARWNGTSGQTCSIGCIFYIPAFNKSQSPCTTAGAMVTLHLLPVAVGQGCIYFRVSSAFGPKGCFLIKFVCTTQIAFSTSVPNEVSQRVVKRKRQRNA